MTVPQDGPEQLSPSGAGAGEGSLWNGTLGSCPASPPGWSALVWHKVVKSTVIAP